MKRHKSIQLRTEVQSPEEHRGVGPAMVPQETFVVSERNHPPRTCPPFLVPRPSNSCQSQEARTKLGSRSSTHSQGADRSIWGKRAAGSDMRVGEQGLCPREAHRLMANPTLMEARRSGGDMRGKGLKVS